MQIEAGVEKKSSRKGLIIILIVLAVIMTAAVGAGIYAYRTVHVDTFYNGTRINGIEMGGLTRNQALEKVKASNQPVMDGIGMRLVYQGKNWTIDSEDMAVAFNNEQIIDDAYKVGRQGSILDRFMTIYRMKKKSREFTTSYTYDLSALQGKIDGIVKEIAVEPTDAAVKFDPKTKEKFTFTESKNGIGVNGSEIMNMIKDRMESGDYSDIPIPAKTLEPQVTIDDLKKATHKIATFTTTMTSNWARSRNIIVASASFNGTIVKPGEIFSINDSTGPRTPAKGYKAAPAIKNGNQLVDETGGGVCQVSGTLYNAVLMADLEIVERWHHSWPSTYVPIGRDATINYGGADFKFKNNRTTPIYIARYINGSRITVDIYGEPLPDNMTIKVISQRTATIPPPAPKITNDPNLPEGTKEEVIKPRTGYKARTYKVYYKDGKKVKTELVTADYYKPVRGEYRIGTGKPAAGKKENSKS